MCHGKMGVIQYVRGAKVGYLNLTVVTGPVGEGQAKRREQQQARPPVLDRGLPSLFTWLPLLEIVDQPPL